MRQLIEEVERVVDWEGNRVRYSILQGILPTVNDRVMFDNFLVSILMNYVPEETWNYCISQAAKCWAELHPGVLPIENGAVN